MRIHHRAPILRRMAGVSLIELMISILLGMLVLAALIQVFASTSASRTELERTSRQIENGRFAMDVLSDEIRMAGFYGEYNLAQEGIPAAIPDPCSTVATDWKLAMRIHLQGFDNGVGVPPCVPGNIKPGTDVLVVRRAATCEAGVAGCAGIAAGQPYIQSSKCATEQPTAPLVFNTGGPYTLRVRDCATVAGVRRYYVNIFYIATDNGSGSPVPTLTELQFDGAAFSIVPLVEGIEELNIEYGIDNNKDGAPDTYTADPTNYTYGGCPLLPDTLPCTPPNNWSKVVTARIYLISRNIDPTPNYVDPKSYTIGMDNTGAQITKTYSDGYKRHAYTGVVRVVNAAERVDVP